MPRHAPASSPLSRFRRADIFRHCLMLLPLMPITRERLLRRRSELIFSLSAIRFSPMKMIDTDDADIVDVTPAVSLRSSPSRWLHSLDLRHHIDTRFRLMTAFAPPPMIHHMLFFQQTPISYYFRYFSSFSSAARCCACCRHFHAI